MQKSRRFFSSETWIIRRGIEITADDAAYASEFSVSIIHRVDVLDQLLHRFFSDGDVFGDLAAIALQMDPVNQ